MRERDKPAEIRRGGNDETLCFPGILSDGRAAPDLHAAERLGNRTAQCFQHVGRAASPLARTGAPALSDPDILSLWRKYHERFPPQFPGYRTRHFLVCGAARH